MPEVDMANKAVDLTPLSGEQSPLLRKCVIAYQSVQAGVIVDTVMNFSRPEDP
ncbi:MAG: hypothetical protein R3C68_10660 [Myxococcota bacterium]